MPIRLRDVVGLLVAVAIPLAVGYLGSMATEPVAQTWYRILDKPTWAPPAWVFGPVWTALYILMGVAAWSIWRLGLDRPGVPLALGLFALQLVINGAWSPIFFGLRSISGGLAVILILWVVLLATTIQFYRLRHIAGLLLVPYLLWVTYAAALNAALFLLNP